MVQQQYWHELYALKTHINYIELQLEKAELMDRRIKLFLAITSSSSIGGWAIWQNLSIVWAFLIAGSQVVTAILPHLPYASRIKTYSSVLTELNSLMVKAEFKWNAIASGKLNSEEINKARFDLISIKSKALDKHIPSTIPSDGKLREESEKLARDYFDLFYQQQ
ncbi:hypothetical protein AB1K39_15805 [Vibrio cholerae]|uniref:hypothetical protein n=2 Tax=Vibrio cholerae TaxID=666 RepID=UPI001159BD0B|nr:hypothetical protein [Vibrio cholerae]EGR1423478.1 hypothetical protein [Vibrio vulnificus]EGQ9395441.1 hypothetical protein [Vibrio cholerae]EGR3952449.1 hypothetical protein [Vibrio cholerae]EIJ0938424.1 hypothetical protein [Vibrio cholerae]EJL6317794.1 hypothetical protein [Vibrio cholerae]